MSASETLWWPISTHSINQISPIPTPTDAAPQFPDKFTPFKTITVAKEETSAKQCHNTKTAENWYSFINSLYLKMIVHLSNFSMFCYFVAICGAAIVYYMTPTDSIGSLGVTAPSNGVSTAQAFGVELMLTFILVFVIFAATDPNRGMAGYGVPLAIGICVFICLMHGVRNSSNMRCHSRRLGKISLIKAWATKRTRIAITSWSLTCFFSFCKKCEKRKTFQNLEDFEGNTRLTLALIHIADSFIWSQLESSSFSWSCRCYEFVERPLGE